MSHALDRDQFINFSDAAKSIGVANDAVFGEIWEALVQAAPKDKDVPVTFECEGKSFTMCKHSVGGTTVWFIAKDSLPKLVEMYGAGARLIEQKPVEKSPVAPEGDQAATDAEIADNGAAAGDAGITDNVKADDDAATNVDTIVHEGSGVAPANDLETSEPATQETADTTWRAHFRATEPKRRQYVTILESRRQVPQLWAHIQDEFYKRDLQVPGAADLGYAFKLPEDSVFIQLEALENATSQLKDNGELLRLVDKLTGAYRDYYKAKNESAARAAA